MKEVAIFIFRPYFMYGKGKYLNQTGFFDEISVQFPKVFVFSYITLNNERTSYAIHFLKRTLQRFASKTPTFFAFNFIVFKQPMSTF